MKARSLILAALGAIAVMAAPSSAEAGDDRRGRYRDDRGGYRHQQYYQHQEYRPQHHYRPEHHYRPHYQQHWRPYSHYAPPPYYAPVPYAYAPPALYFGFGFR